MVQIFTKNSITEGGERKESQLRESHRPSTAAPFAGISQPLSGRHQKSLKLGVVSSSAASVLWIPRWPSQPHDAYPPSA